MHDSETKSSISETGDSGYVSTLRHEVAYLYRLFNGGVLPLLEPSVPSLRSYGSMRSWCIHDGYEAFLTMRRSTFGTVWKP